MTNQLGASVAVLCGALLLACSSTSPSSSPASAGAGSTGGESAGAGAPSLADVTYHKHVEPILQRSCQSCHVTGGIAPFPLLTYSQQRLSRGRSRSKPKTESMPPWHAEDTAECAVPLGWKDDTRLTDLEIATLEAWQVAGDARGRSERRAACPRAFPATARRAAGVAADDSLRTSARQRSIPLLRLGPEAHQGHLRERRVRGPG